MPSTLATFFHRRLLLVLGFMIASHGSHASPPASAANLRGVLLPAEIVLSWDASPDAAYYRVLRTGLDRRWMLDAHVTGTRLRDGDFRSLPTYYQVIAYNAAGEAAAPVECLVSDRPLTIDFFGVNPRPVSDTSFAISWNLNEPGDARLEVGLSPTNYTWVTSSSAFASRQEFVLSQLAPTTTYYYRITSANASGVGVTYSGSFATRSFTEPAPVVVP